MVLKFIPLPILQRNIYLYLKAHWLIYISIWKLTYSKVQTSTNSPEKLKMKLTKVCLYPLKKKNTFISEWKSVAGPHFMGLLTVSKESVLRDAVHSALTSSVFHESGNCCLCACVLHASMNSSLTRLTQKLSTFIECQISGTACMGTETQ